MGSVGCASPTPGGRVDSWNWPGRNGSGTLPYRNLERARCWRIPSLSGLVARTGGTKLRGRIRTPESNDRGPPGRSVSYSGRQMDPIPQFAGSSY
jgi:hypothetical protein